MQSRWSLALEAVTSTAIASLAAISAAAHAATTRASSLCRPRGARVGVDTCPVTDPGEWTHAQELSR